MLNLLRKGKAGRTFAFENIIIGWQEAVNSSEDFITSNFFERLFYLPQPIIWEILVGALINRPAQLPQAEILQYEFWPGWKLDNRVEPDLFIRCSNLDIIVEVKARDDDNSQWTGQWAKQVQAYDIAYGLGCNHVIILAVGGNNLNNNINDTIEVNGRVVTVYKINWSSLLHALVAAKASLAQQSGYHTTHNILSDMIEYLNYHGYYAREFLDSFHSTYKISSNTFYAFEKGKPGMMDGLSTGLAIKTKSLTTFSTPE